MSYNKGDLVWLPSNITLTQMNDQREVSKWMRVDRPTNAVILDGPIGAYYSILFEGQQWLARKIDVFEPNGILEMEDVD